MQLAHITAAEVRITLRCTDNGRTASRLTSILYNNKLPVAVRLIVWSALARSQLDYGAELIEPSTSDEARLSRCVWRAGKLIMGTGPSCLIRALEADLGLLSYLDRACHLALRWRIRVASRPTTELTRRVWDLAVENRIASLTVTRIEALVGVSCSFTANKIAAHTRSCGMPCAVLTQRLI